MWVCTPSCWVLIAVGLSMGGIYPQVCQLQGLAVTTDHHGGSAVQGPTPQSKIEISSVLIPAEFTSWMCCLWMWFGGALTWSKAVHKMHWLQGLPRIAVQSHLLPMPCLGPLSMNYKAICRWLLDRCASLGGVQVSPGCKPRQAVASAGPAAIYREVQSTMWQDAPCLRDFRKV